MKHSKLVSGVVKMWKILITVSLIGENFGWNFSDRTFNIDCGGIFTKKQAVVESSNYPGSYSPHLDCSYLLKGPFCPTYFNLQFLDFNLEASEGCTKDRLEVEDQDALCGIKSGIKTYFAKTGALQLRFISDGENSGRGFRILVTRLPCIQNLTKQSFPPTVNSIGGENWPAPTTSTVNPLNPPNGLGSFCCASNYNSNRFLLTSPGFPNSNRHPVDCVYHIYKAHPNICRLRIHFLFFWNGEQDVNCNGAFLQIDGKVICGCWIGLKVISAFDQDSPKILRFKNDGDDRNTFSGFALEVIQDECPKRIAPAAFYFFGDEFKETASESSPSLRTEILDDANVTVVKDYYFFRAPEPGEVPNTSRDVEKTTYVDTGSVQEVFPDGYDNGKCRAWGILQWTLLTKDILWRNTPKCDAPRDNNCRELNGARGFIQSPGYPFYYPSNLNICYRFRKQLGHCSIKLILNDFQLENSVNCQNDYLLFEKRYKYCGSRLLNTVSTLDLTYKDYEDVYFTTNDYYCGRGFRGIYEQVPCDTPRPVPVTPFPPVVTTPSVALPYLPCGGMIQDESFHIEISSNHKAPCSFYVLKKNSNVCRLQISFINFNTNCDEEYLLIGERRYCGRLDGEQVVVEFSSYQLQVTYSRAVPQLSSTGWRVSLQGTQLSAGCDPFFYPQVPAERLTTRINSTKISDKLFFEKYLNLTDGKNSTFISGR